MNMSFLQELLSNATQRDAPFRRRSDQHIHPDHAQLGTACKALLESDGEASSIALASGALEIYALLSTEEKARFFALLTAEFSADPLVIDQAYAAYRESRNNQDMQNLFDACEPRRQELFRRLNLSSGGTYELVRMREDVLGLMHEYPEFRAIDVDFAHLFASWFNRGFLILKRIDWDTSAAILEKLIRYEAVHKIHGWDDLRRRLDARDRRCFAFFHPAIGDEPLIFLEVALHKGLPNQTQAVLASDQYHIDDPRSADTAAFFGISNCQTGLRGISFGNFLIKQVVQELQQELPNLRYFVTLSPVPGFRKWLGTNYPEASGRLDSDAQHVLKHLDDPDWHNDASLSQQLDKVIKPLGADYLLNEKNEQGLPLNPVARFHLGNGAELHRINWLGDTSTKGIRQSAGLMVNYLYVLRNIERNHEQYTINGTIACSSGVSELGRRARKLFKGEASK